MKQSVILTVEGAGSLGEVAADLGLHLVDAPGGGGKALRPWVVVDGGEVGMCVVACVAGTPSIHVESVPVRMIAGPAGIVVVAPDPVLDDVRRVVEEAEDSLLACADVLVLLAAGWEEALEDLVELAEELSGSLRGLRSSGPRARIAQLRAQLFAIRHRMIGQARMLEPGGELSEALPVSARRRATRARLAFESAGSTATQTYQMLGDALTRQATTVNERLTLATVVFLPLTAISGVFGMNFGWLVDNLTTPTSFWVLGVALPCLVVLAILLAVRRIDADDKADRE